MDGKPTRGTIIMDYAIDLAENYALFTTGKPIEFRAISEKIAHRLFEYDATRTGAKLDLRIHALPTGTTYAPPEMAYAPPQMAYAPAVPQATEPMFCSKCGKKGPFDGSFCSGCGGPL